MSQVEKLLIIPDTHIPYHDKKAWKLLLEVAEKFKPHTILHLGDLGDHYAISRYDKDPERSLNMSDEIEQVNEGLDQLDALGAKRKILISGNHEDRLKRYLQEKAPELYSFISIESLYKLKERNWEHVPYKQSIRIGKIHFTHDTGDSGKYTTMRALETFQSSVTIGHHHQIQYVVHGDATGQYRVGAQFGWLGDVNKVDYMHQVKAKRMYALGFGVGYHDTKSSIIYLQPCPIVKYSCCVEGEIFKV